MRAVREQPRRVAAKLTIGLVVLIVAVAVGSALASDGDGPSANLRPRLDHSQQLLRAQSTQLDRLTEAIAELRQDLQTATRRVRARRRVGERLRRELRATRRNLARERRK